MLRTTENRTVKHFIYNVVSVREKSFNIHKHIVTRFKDGKATYGTESPARGRRVIFCVHGNPSTGCCAVIETSADGDDGGRQDDSISEAERE